MPALRKPSPPMPVSVAWIFSLPRSGTSITAYAAAAPWGHAVLDEPLGPWDRTGPPYNYPPLQRALMREYHAQRCMLTPDVVAMANELFEIVGAPTGRLIVKHPHLKPSPDEFARAFPTHRAIWVMRNPLTRLNSLYTRGWTDSLRPNHEIEHFRAFAKNWLGRRERIVFEHMKRDPAAYFTRIWRAWGWDHSRDDVARAVEYARGNYHASSGVKEEAGEAPPVSDRYWSLPEEALALYLRDPFMRRLMRRVGWPTIAAAYREDHNDPAWARRWTRWRGYRPPPRADYGVAAVKQPADAAAQPNADSAMANAPAQPPHARPAPHVVWLFSMTRSGSSVTAYAAAHAARAAVADEVFGPWDRTGPPYLYPREQLTLKQRFHEAGERLTQEVIDLAERVFRGIDERDGGGSARIIAKMPHLMLDPDDFRRAYPAARSVWLLRNPLHRLNSFHLRGWLKPIRPDHDLADFKRYAAQWLEAEHRVMYDDLLADPAGYFRAIFAAWQWPATDEVIAAAVNYVATKYHISSMRRDHTADPAHPRSLQAFALPAEAIEAYLSDAFVLDLMRQCGWSTDPADYAATRPQLS